MRIFYFKKRLSSTRFVYFAGENGGESQELKQIPLQPPDVNKVNEQVAKILNIANGVGEFSSQQKRDAAMKDINDAVDIGIKAAGLDHDLVVRVNKEAWTATNKINTKIRATIDDFTNEMGEAAHEAKQGILGLISKKNN